MPQHHDAAVWGVDTDTNRSVSCHRLTLEGLALDVIRLTLNLTVLYMTCMQVMLAVALTTGTTMTSDPDSAT